MRRKPFLLLSFLVLIGYTVPVAGQVTADLSTGYTTPSYLGGSISVTVGVHNLASVIARVSRVEIRFDWSQTFTGNVPIMIQPGASYQWSFSDCSVPEHAWAGKHSYDVTVLIAWADSSGGWGQDNTGTLKTDFNVEQPPPPQAIIITVTQEAPPPIEQTWSGYLPALLVVGLLLVGVIAAISIRRPQTPVKTEAPESQSSTGSTREAATRKECRVCHNINPPHAQNYCVKCGSKLE